MLKLPQHRLLPVLIAAMVFLAALSGAASLAAARLADQWRGAADGTTVEVPEQDGAAVAALLGPAAHRLSQDELAAVLQPWLGKDAGRLTFALPAVFTLPGSPPAGLEQALVRAAPGALVSHDTVWQEQASALADSVQACGTLTACVVAFVAAGIVVLATGASLAEHQEAIEVIHHLGAADGLIAGKFAARASVLALAGAVAGSVSAALTLLALARLTAPFQPPAPAFTLAALAARLPPAVWALLAVLPLLATLIGWLTAQATARAWLRRLP